MFLFLLVMSDQDEDKQFHGPHYLEDFDFYPYNMEEFALLDQAAQLQYALDLKRDFKTKIDRLKRISFNEHQKKWKINDLYEWYYIHDGAACIITTHIFNYPVKLNGMH